MKDQAAQLRRLMSADRRGTATFVIGSGKGGVGKSVLSVLLASALARLGNRVLLFDGCQNHSNLRVLLGVRPAATRDRLLSHEVEPEDLLVPAAERLWLLPGDSGAETFYRRAAVDRARLHHRLSALYDAFDAVVVDSSPGIESVMRAAMRACRLVVTTTAPASLSDSYALIKMVTHQVPSLPIDVLVNRTRSPEEGVAAFERLALAADRFLRRSVTYLGAVPEDATLERRVLDPGTLLHTIPAPVTAMAARIAPLAAPPDANGKVA